MAYFGLSKRFKIDAKSHPIFNVVFEAILAGFWVPLGLHFGGLGPILGGKNFNFLWMSFLNRFLLDFGPLWGAFWGTWTSSLVPKTAYFPGSRSGAGFSFSLWSLKGCRGLDWGPTNGPFHFHPYILRFLTQRRPPGPRRRDS